jgi:hypothetical protein
MSKSLVVVGLAALASWGCAHQGRPSMPVAQVKTTIAEASPQSPALLAEPVLESEPEPERRADDWTLAQARASGCGAIPR